MIQEIAPNLFQLEIPLPDNPLKAVNSYVIKAPERNMIIDTGLNREECLGAMHAGLRKLNINLEKTDFFITHLHADHMGLVAHLVTDISIVYFNQPDADFISNVGRWKDMCDFARKNGFPENELGKAIEKHPGYRHRAPGQLKFHILRDGDILSIGEYFLKCVETPGHTKGHMCLYEPNKKILFSGDHLLYGITPNISLWSDGDNPLREYLASLDKIYEFDISLVLPGHRSVFRNHRKRILELKSHHQARIDEIISILEKGGMDAYQVASRMSWDMTCDSWDLFPAAQKWFATGEAVAHLKYLEEKGVLQREVKGQKIFYARK
ncbi:MAG: MBL fold metallo-hydrolase [Bacillota bacterium]